MQDLQERKMLNFQIFVQLGPLKIQEGNVELQL